MVGTGGTDPVGGGLVTGGLVTGGLVTGGLVGGAAVLGAAVTVGGGVVDAGRVVVGDVGAGVEEEGVVVVVGEGCDVAGTVVRGGSVDGAMLEPGSTLSTGITVSTGGRPSRPETRKTDAPAPASAVPATTASQGLRHERPARMPDPGAGGVSPVMGGTVVGAWSARSRKRSRSSCSKSALGSVGSSLLISTSSRDHGTELGQASVDQGAHGRLTAADQVGDLAVGEVAEVAHDDGRPLPPTQ
jgi:hypothetical protein